MFFCGKLIKYTAITAGGTMLLGGVIFGRDLFSYVSTGTRAVQTSVRESVPVEFELRRAKDMVDDILPELHANVRLIAQQEVEIEDLKIDITRSEKSLGDERVRLTSLRDALNKPAVTFTVAGVDYTRDQVKEELSRRLELSQEAETVLAGKKRLLDNRQRSLAAAVQALNHARQQKEMLVAQIASLESQNRLVQAAGSTSDFAIDNTKLAQSQKLLGEIKNRLDVTERVLAHEARFVAPVRVESINESELKAKADEFLASSGR